MFHFVNFESFYIYRTEFRGHLFLEQLCFPKFVLVVVQIANLFDVFRYFLDRVEYVLELLLVHDIVAYFVYLSLVDVELVQDFLGVLGAHVGVKLAV